MIKIQPYFLTILLLMAALITIFTACEKKPPEPAACRDTIGCVEVAPEDPLKIGVLQALSGDVANLGQEQIRGIELALDKIDHKIFGHKIVTQVEDSGCRSEGGANAVLKLIADPTTIAILGTTCSGAAATAAHAMSQAGLTMISGNNSAPFLTSIAGEKAPDWHDGYFRTASNEEYAGKAAAIYAYRRLKITKAATINDGDIYTKGLTEGFRQEFEQLGGKVVLNASIGKGDQEMRPVLEGVILSEAALLFFPLFQPEGNHLLLQAKTMPKFADIILMSDGALIESSFIEKVQDAGKGMYFVGPASPASSPESEKLGQEYKDKFQTEPSAIYYTSAFDAANLLFRAIKTSASVRADNSLSIGRKALRDALYATKSLQGITGELNCDSFGDCAAPHFNILRLDDPKLGLKGLQNNILFSLSPK